MLIDVHSPCYTHCCKQAKSGHLVYLLYQCSSFKILNGFLKVLLLKVVRSQPGNHADVAGEVPKRLDRNRPKINQC